MKLLPLTDHTPAGAEDRTVLALANDAAPLQAPLEGVTRIDLHFPKFTDGRAFSQAFLLRRRRGFAGEIRATGDVLADQLAQMERSGFDVAVLRADQDMATAQRVLASYPGYGVGRYQGDAVHVAPHFAEAA
ncbi:MAG: DUF934 domain-containing protein [Polaromonas sp.]|uniref:DUF934 domain-containing protein n=1 Tax=Polaromonas sp. TaxID=1869339 RepID=UPI00272FD6E0|nr:DUF934 domain-containing protein [Polaromonas sp.]MDP2451070.1 DUF934 domain-containing protein [Polaromonas sp.]MDP3249407.1 DUF934 domain-containing protein [Polaromonas sp.]MDP3757585.1 DUF934 domain-containing protein [Polaromonas sp.]MDP3829153.1 DUF934 domain-containing protein [Polaromonas sp.]